jgi:hypothetical protein
LDLKYRKPYEIVVVKGDGRNVGFQDGGYILRFLKCENINNHALLAIVDLTLNLTPNLTLTLTQH